ncbi:AbrB/MazE/SpoVT family DNA-binding domain-containing protein [Alkalihalobacterium alkalinitrilicum]|uniref:AbrB/MazE/SpoVT family DNA-binding domain-containing protein n=1 Tax=Alkalihalobacterium alkalinitrilicum TaxID=427920 RepID=UPI001302EA93|nr:AbrB/MazE/SpoVT family DNA-binding domain-containing protein [Alkalihalobacterium alkalinitrilicum]
MNVCKISNRGLITFSKKVREQLNLANGKLYSVYVYHKDKTIIIEPLLEESTHNQCVFHQGRITIPKEIRNLLNIGPNDHFIVEGIGERIFLKKEY